MSEAIELAELMHMTPGLFPWVVLAIVLFFVYKERSTIKNLIQSRIDANKNIEKHNTIIDELIRNNTAALENNTAVLKAFEGNRDMTRNLIESHEEMSKERVQHLQTVMNRLDKTLTKNNNILGLLEDRTESNRTSR